MDRLTIYLRSALERLLPSEQKPISKVAVKREVLTNITEFAKTSYPNEFVAALEGQAKEGTLHISGMLYQPFHSSSKAAVITGMDLPLTSAAIGSVHSHPSPNTSPSKEDLKFFSKKGVAHFIVGYPFREKDVACFDLNGNRIDYDIIE